MPGFVVDRYDRVAVLRTDGDAAAARVDGPGRRARPALASWSVSTHRSPHRPKGQPRSTDVLLGDPPPATVIVRSTACPSSSISARGQKTGAFLDQRDNRRRVRELASGARVLNLFSYAGGFSLLRGGGRSPPRDERRRRGRGACHGAGELPRRRASTLARTRSPRPTSSRSSMARAARRSAGTSSSAIRPSFAPNEKSVGRALTAYRNRCTRRAPPCSPRAGLLCAASCSSHVGADAFLSTLDDATLGARRPAAARDARRGARPPDACPPSPRVAT